MPGIVRKLVIFATVDGLIIRPHAGWDYDHSVRIDFKDRSIGPCAKEDSNTSKESPHLESHGIIGLLIIASSSFLLCITRREQVAQIFGKPIYVVKDIAILPLSSQADANEAIIHARGSPQKERASKESDPASSASEGSGYESFDENSVGDPSESQTPVDTSLSTDGANESTTGVVQNVIERKGQYGRYASQWLSRKGWGLGNKQMETTSTRQAPNTDTDSQRGPSESVNMCSQEASPAAKSEAVHQQTADEEVEVVQNSSHEAATQMLPKILRTTKLLLTSQSFYFSYDHNLTKRFGSSSAASGKSVSPENVEQHYFWNRQLALPFFKAGYPSAIMPIMQGFVGQQPFVVKTNSGDKTNVEASDSLDGVLKADTVETAPKQSDDGPQHTHSFLLTLISRRSVKRSGLRYLRRGIDDEGNCANSVETEQILSSPTWDNPAEIRSFVQFRASIPLYFSQSPYAFKPVPVLQQSPETNRLAFDRHFEDLRRRYGSVQIVLLVDKKGGEKRIGEEYEKVTKSSNKTSGTHELGFEWFDFHTECRGMKFENVQKLVQTLEPTLTLFGETVIDGQTTQQNQTGIIRTNCMDCLDRTNVVQSALAQYMLQKHLEKDGLEIDFVHDSSTRWFNTLWADNGDAVSRQYASTAALKGDYTRTRKRDYRGALNDFGLTLTRYYNNIVNDYFSQTVIDFLLANVTARAFDDFEATMKSEDLGVSMERVRQRAIDTCSKIVIQHPEEDFINGWALSAPAQTNTLRTLPFQEAILLLTGHAIYGCKFDWNMEKVASFERIDLRSVTKIHYGTYITSTLTEGQMNEDNNVGLVISYKPGKESIKRVNTRSLQVSDDGEAEQKSDGSRESGVLSWLQSRNLATSHCMAMKVIPHQSHADEKIDPPLVTAERICSEIRRVIADGIDHSARSEVDLVEKADIISLAEARSRTGYLEQIGHSIKKLVWT